MDFPETGWNIATRFQFNRKYSVSKSVSGKSKMSKTYSSVEEWALFEMRCLQCKSETVELSFYSSLIQTTRFLVAFFEWIARWTNELFEPLKCFLLWFLMWNGNSLGNNYIFLCVDFGLCHFESTHSAVDQRTYTLATHEVFVCFWVTDVSTHTRHMNI